MLINVVSINQAEMFNIILAKLCYSDTTEKSFLYLIWLA